METIIVAVFTVILGVNCYVMWLMWKELRNKNIGIMNAQPDNGEILEHVEELEDKVESIRSVLTKASRLKAIRPEPQPASDKIQDRVSPRSAYVPIARRRAVAEAASHVAVTHDARVRENNARAIETAG
jgi:hypothetical protein